MEIAQVWASLFRATVDEPDQVDPVLRMLKKLSADQLPDVAGADDERTLTVRRLASSGGALFRQTRLGMDMREFTLLKFRTMKEHTDAAEHRDYIAKIMDSSAVAADGSTYKLKRPHAVTRVGRWLRATSLDELPQLLNVLRGDMSLVGPRPCISYEVGFFERHHFERFLVPAGLTGLWQVEARARSTFVEALNLDVLYARGWSLGLDLRLLLRTPLMLLRKGVTR